MYVSWMEWKRACPSMEVQHTCTCIWKRGCPDVEERGTSTGDLACGGGSGGASAGDPCGGGRDYWWRWEPDVEEQVASTGGLVVAWTSQYEGNLMKLAGYPLEVQWTLLQYSLLSFSKHHHFTTPGFVIAVMN